MVGIAPKLINELAQCREQIKSLQRQLAEELQNEQRLLDELQHLQAA